MTFLEPDRFWWLWLVPALAAVTLVAGLRLQRNLHRFATPERLGATLPTRSRTKAASRAVLLLLCLALTLTALADPRRGEREREVPPGDGVSVVFALDVSRSMLAQDVSPNRLDRAKQYIRELTQVLAEREDDASVGLVAFAGAVKRIAPVTRNFNEVELALQATDVTSAGGGRIQPGRRGAGRRRSFVARRPGHKVVVMLTDGEENLSGEPAEAARAAFDERGVRFFPVGLGSPETGATIPQGNGRVLIHDGEPVKTTLDAAALKAVAENGGGVYLPAETKRVDMDEVYRRVIRPRLNAASAERASDPNAAGTAVKGMIPRFDLWVWPALALLLIERLIAGWPARRYAGVAAAMLLVVVTLPASAQNNAPDPRSAYNAAVAAQSDGDVEAARAGFAEAAQRGVGVVESRARYNLGREAHESALASVTQAAGQAAAPAGSATPAAASGSPASTADPLALLDKAIREYAAALGADPGFDDARANLEAAARLRQQLQDQQEQQQQEEEQEQQDPQQDPSSRKSSRKGRNRISSPTRATLRRTGSRRTRIRPKAKTKSRRTNRSRMTRPPSPRQVKKVSHPSLNPNRSRSRSPNRSLTPTSNPQTPPPDPPTPRPLRKTIPPRRTSRPRPKANRKPKATPKNRPRPRRVWPPAMRASRPSAPTRP